MCRTWDHLRVGSIGRHRKTVAILSRLGVPGNRVAPPPVLGVGRMEPPPPVLALLHSSAMLVRAPSYWVPATRHTHYTLLPGRLGTCHQLEPVIIEL